MFGNWGGRKHFPVRHPAHCHPVQSLTQNGCGNLWPPQLVTGEISVKGHHGKGVGPYG